ncbi:hypothetical protein [Microlunatus sagamiharensis]|uniref:hypothetical protein n=1 Tax=Microlunatus sagamiharensis TaxID=546874 RepID=UPI0012FE6B08|nr:hypothetical protein [Microlunatus sagamiharensis]
MRRREYTASELSRLGDIVGQRPARLAAHVSNGPWYGFNGIQALVLTNEAVYRVQQGWALLPDRVIDKYLLSDISEPRWTSSRAGRTGRISFNVASARHSYASKWQEAADLALALERIVSAS